MPTGVKIGGEACTQPYSASVLNISAMSFGSLSGNAIEALNLGAKMGGFYHDTGEGGISPYHLMHGGDIVWEIGTGYFGCRTADGRFDAQKFADKAAARSGQDDRDQAEPGRQARPWRPAARRQGDAGDRRGARRAGRQGRALAARATPPSTRPSR